MSNIKKLRLRWGEGLSGENNTKLSIADYINIILSAHAFGGGKVKAKDVAKMYSQTTAYVMELFETARKERVLPESPFGLTDDGLIDYRGFPLKQQLVRLQIRNVDFSYTISEGAGSLNTCKVKNSLFVETNFDGTPLGSVFENCNFNNASLKNGGFGSPENLYLLDCTFIDTNFTGAGAHGAKFTRCSFERSNMKKAHFISCVFEECNFGGAKFHNGSLAGCKFISDRPSDEQLGNTVTKS